MVNGTGTITYSYDVRQVAIMLPPLAIQDLITTSLKEMHDDPHHHLRPARRLDIYRELGWSADVATESMTQFDRSSHLILPIGYRRYAYLALLTARYVLPLWEQEIPEMQLLDETIETDVPHHLLEAGETILQQRPEAIEAARLLGGQAHEWLGAICYDVSYRARCAAAASYRAFAMILGAPPFRVPVGRSHSDDDLDWSQGDVAMNAVEAYAVLDRNATDAQNYIVKAQVSVRLDLDKRQTFWEWWLKEAILQAWELAAEHTDAS